MQSFRAFWLTVLSLFIASMAGAQTIPNPSFESNTFTVFPGYANSNGGVINGWTLSNTNGIGLNPSGGSPFADNGAIPDGANVAFIQSSGSSGSATNTLSTTITGLTSGKAYRVSFRANCRTVYADPNPSWSLNGGPEVPFTAAPAVGALNPYYTNTGIFTATASTAALVLRNASTNDTTVLLDAFSITPSATVVTLPATGLSNAVAQLNGTVNPNGLATTYYFQYGLQLFQVNAGSTTPTNALAAGGAPVAVNAALSGLTPGLVYRGRLVASNEVGIVFGNEVRFGSPAIALNGAAVLTNECHLPFTDPGAMTFGAPLLIAGGGSYSLAMKNDGKVVVWGANDNGQASLPPGLSNVLAIAAGLNHSLALKSDGKVAAWGASSKGQISVPAGLSNVVAIAAGGDMSLALKSDGTLVGWGNDTTGTNIPVGLSNVVAIAQGGQGGGVGVQIYHRVALKSDGTVVAWGNNFVATNIPASLGLSNNVVAIAAGNNHTVVLRRDGGVSAWGNNSLNQVSFNDSPSNFVAIAAGGNHNLALKSDGTVVAWGLNDLGQAIVPANLSNVVAIAAGGSHSLALKSDGTVAAWGFNGSGQTTLPADLSMPSVATTGSVDPNVLGSYQLTYSSSSNLFGGINSPVSRTVVVQDTLPPVVALLGSNPILITNLSNLPMADPGITNFDLCNGNANSVIVSNHVNVNFPGTYSIVYQVTDARGNSASATRTVIVALPPAVPGDQNGDGLISQSELDGVYANYVTNSPWLKLTNVAGLGGTNVTFSLSNSALGAYSVEYSTNLTDWLPLGPATPRYLFTDTNAPATPQRYYRLRYP